MINVDVSDKNGVELNIGDYVRCNWQVNPTRSFESTKYTASFIAKILSLDDEWCINQWIAKLEICSSKYITSENCSLIEKLSNEEAMLFLLEK
jgi:hypothetical protein